MRRTSVVKARDKKHRACGDATGLYVLYLLYLPVVESAVQESEHCEIMTKLTISVSNYRELPSG